MKRKAQYQPSSIKRQRPLKRQKSVLPGVVLKRRTAEKKNLDVQNTAHIVAAATGATQWLLNGCDDGATSTTRVGRSIIMTSIYIRWAGSFAATTAGTSPLRLVVVYDRQSNAAAPAITDVFQIDQITSQLNLSNNKRFQVLIDETVQELGTSGPSSWYREIYRDFTQKGRVAGLNTEFNNNSTALIDSITSGSVYAYCWQNGNIITAAPTHACYSRIRFLDS